MHWLVSCLSASHSWLQEALLAPEALLVITLLATIATQTDRRGNFGHMHINTFIICKCMWCWMCTCTVLDRAFTPSQHATKPFRQSLLSIPLKPSQAWEPKTMALYTSNW